MQPNSKILINGKKEKSMNLHQIGTEALMGQCIDFKVLAFTLKSKRVNLESHFY